MHSNFAKAIAAGLLVVTPVAVAAPSAFAARPRAIETGSCSIRGNWKLKVSTQDRGLELQIEAENLRPGTMYAVSATDNGTSVLSVNRTVNQFGKIRAKSLIPNQPGTDTVVFTATDAVSGNTCTGTVSLG